MGLFDFLKKKKKTQAVQAISEPISEDATTVPGVRKKHHQEDVYYMIKAQDDQIDLIKNAEAKYEADKDIDFIIAFWEQLWANGGLVFEGSHWHFRLADLYISQKRYDDAIAFCKRIKKIKKNYSDKADRYIQRIEEKKNNATMRK